MRAKRLLCMKALVIIPTYNESSNIERLAVEIINASPILDVIIIDDSSTDGTAELADDLSKRFGNVKVIHRPSKSGRGSAIARGFLYAIENGYDFAIEMDADFSHSPRDIPRLLEEARYADLVIASRFLAGGEILGWNFRRRFLHFMADAAVKVILGTPNTDHTNGFRCYRVESLKKIEFGRFSNIGYVGQTLLENIFWRLGMRIREIPVSFQNRKFGVSKMGIKEMAGGLLALLGLRWRLATRGVNYYLTNHLSNHS